MSYVLRRKGETKGWVFAEYEEEALAGHWYISTGKLKCAHIFDTEADAAVWLDKYNDWDYFDIITYQKALEEK